MGGLSFRFLGNPVFRQMSFQGITVQVFTPSSFRVPKTLEIGMITLITTIRNLEMYHHNEHTIVTMIIIVIIVVI